jgi:hypothetical protein
VAVPDTRDVRRVPVGGGGSGRHSWCERRAWLARDTGWRRRSTSDGGGGRHGWALGGLPVALAGAMAPAVASALAPARWSEPPVPTRSVPVAGCWWARGSCVRALTSSAAPLLFLGGEAGPTLLRWWGRGSTGSCWRRGGGASGYAVLLPVEVPRLQGLRASVFGGECAKRVVFPGKSLHSLWQWWRHPWGVTLPAEGTIEEYHALVAQFSRVKTQPPMGVRRRRHRHRGLLFRRWQGGAEGPWRCSLGLACPVQW